MVTHSDPPTELSSPTDAVLIARVAKGDRIAFEELHRRYARAVFGLALRRIRDRQRAEDATQEAFASLWRSANRYDPARGAGAPWLFVVARNAVTDVLRRTPEAAVDQHAEQAGTDPGPDQRAEAAFEAWQVHRAVATLPETERRLIELAYWGGLSHSEIAAYVDLPLGTVKTRIRAGLRRLATSLAEELE
jgi:RNA polymerase sigma-70 factor (ECF subfamily)